jgi:hypothetical protein
MVNVYVNDYKSSVLREGQSRTIDTDTASDDAVGLVMALRHPEAEVAITMVAAARRCPSTGEQRLRCCGRWRPPRRHTGRTGCATWGSRERFLELLHASVR